jgi:hypothetical protein
MYNCCLLIYLWLLDIVLSIPGYFLSSMALCLSAYQLRLYLFVLSGCYIINKYSDCVGTDFASSVDEHRERNLITKHVYFNISEGRPYDRRVITMLRFELCTAACNCAVDDRLCVGIGLLLLKQ